MPYFTKGKCVYKKEDGSKVGCTKGSVKKYLAALHANANEGILKEDFKLTKLLREMTYDKIFSPSTINSLKGKSKESLRQMLGNKNFMQVVAEGQRLLADVIQIERPYVRQLEVLTVKMMKHMYPIIGYNNIKIDAKIVTEFDEHEEEEEQEPQDPEEEAKAKRRVINGITQGSSIRGGFGFMMFREALDKIDPRLYDKYNELMKGVFGIFDDENAIALMLQMLAMNANAEGAKGGMVKIKIKTPKKREDDEEGEEPLSYDITIIAQALCFPMLLHECVKGLYEIVATEGFGPDPEANKAIIHKMDKLEAEPHDMQMGKFIYDALNNLFIDSNEDDFRVRELLFAEIYKLDDKQFLNFIENAINEKLTPAQKRWVEQQIKEIAHDIRADDSDSVTDNY